MPQNAAPPTYDELAQLAVTARRQKASREAYKRRQIAAQKQKRSKTMKFLVRHPALFGTGLYGAMFGIAAAPVWIPAAAAGTMRKVRYFKGTDGPIGPPVKESHIFPPAKV